MQEIFMNMVMATTVGNFITFFLVILVLGMFWPSIETDRHCATEEEFKGFVDGIIPIYKSKIQMYHKNVVNEHIQHEERWKQICSRSKNYALC
jgi:hypothetical protein